LIGKDFRCPDKHFRCVFSVGKTVCSLIVSVCSHCTGLHPLCLTGIFPISTRKIWFDWLDVSISPHQLEAKFRSGRAQGARLQSLHACRQPTRNRCMSADNRPASALSDKHLPDPTLVILVRPVSVFYPLDKVGETISSLSPVYRHASCTDPHLSEANFFDPNRVAKRHRFTRAD
jgi:hypothetical protein